MSKYNWDFLGRLYGQDSHKLFYSLEYHRYSIADNSGRKPHQTGDGILWLDFSRPLLFMPSYTAKWHLECSVPVLDERSELEARFTTTFIGACRLLDIVSKTNAEEPGTLNFTYEYDEEVCSEMREVVDSTMNMYDAAPVEKKKKFKVTISERFYNYKVVEVVADDETQAKEEARELFLLQETTADAADFDDYDLEAVDVEVAV